MGGNFFNNIVDALIFRELKTISWPVGLSGGFQGSLSARDNVKFVSRIYGYQGDAMREKVSFVEEFAEIGQYFDEPVKTFSSGMRSRVAFGLSMAFDFDYYLIDEAGAVGYEKKVKNLSVLAKISLTTDAFGADNMINDQAQLFKNYFF